MGLSLRRWSAAVLLSISGGTIALPAYSVDWGHATSSDVPAEATGNAMVDFRGHYLSTWVIEDGAIHYCLFDVPADAEPAPGSDGDSIALQLEFGIRSWMRAIEEHYPDVAKVTLRRVRCDKVVEKNRVLVVLLNTGRRPAYGQEAESFSREETRSLQSKEEQRLNKNARAVTAGRPYIIHGGTAVPRELEGGRRLESALDEILGRGVSGAEPYRMSDFYREYVPSADFKKGDSYSLEVLVHELGHAFGLADEYTAAYFWGRDPRFGFQSQAYATTAIMNGCDLLVPTCDDTEALLFMFDRISGADRGEFPSLCKERKGVYRKGRPVGTWSIESQGNDDVVYEVEFNEEGKPDGLLKWRKEGNRGEDLVVFCRPYHDGASCGYATDYEYDPEDRLVNKILNTYDAKIGCPIDKKYRCP